MTTQDDFTKLYERYRLVDAISYHGEKADVCRRRRFLLLGTTQTTLVLAIACYSLIGIQVHQAELWAVAGSIMLSATLALVTPTVVVNYGRQENLHQQTVHELTVMRESAPGPSAGEPEVSRWVWQTETILHGAQADPRPLPAPPTTPPAGSLAS